MAANTQESTYRPVNDAYTGMLTISLIAMITGSVLLYLDYQQYPLTSPPAPKKQLPEDMKAPAAAPKKEAPPVEQPKEEPKVDPEKKDDKEMEKKDDGEMKKEEMKKEEEKKDARLILPPAPFLTTSFDRPRDRPEQVAAIPVVVPASGPQPIVNRLKTRFATK